MQFRYEIAMYLLPDATGMLEKWNDEYTNAAIISIPEIFDSLARNISIAMTEDCWGFERENRMRIEYHEDLENSGWSGKPLRDVASILEYNRLLVTFLRANRVESRNFQTMRNASNVSKEAYFLEMGDSRTFLPDVIIMVPLLYLPDITFLVRTQHAMINKYKE